MFGLANSLATILQWVIFLTAVVALVWAAIVITRWMGFGSKGRRRTGITVGVLALVLLNAPFNRFLGRMYFEHLCETEAGESIYRTVDNVAGFYLMKPRDPRDYFDRVWANDPPEDPYGHTNWEAQDPATLFVDPPFRNYTFVELPVGAGPTDGLGAPGYIRYSGHRQEQRSETFVRQHGQGQEAHGTDVEAVPTLTSVYAYTWSEESNALSRVLGIHRGELRVIEIATGEVLAKHVGFIRLHGGGVCPAGKEEELAYTFVSKVLRPISPDRRR